MFRFFFADLIVKLVYGSEYQPSVILLQLTSLGYLFYYGPPYGIAFAAMDKQRLNFIVSLVCAIVNVVLNLVLIPRHGALGAAISTIITYVLMKVLYSYYYRKLRIPILDKSYLFIAGFSLVLVIVAKVVVRTYQLHIVVVMLGYTVIYALVVYRVLLKSEEIKRLVRR